MLRMQDTDLKNKRVLIREDFNVPLQNGKITSVQRLQAALPGIRAARDAGARVMLMSHMGRPREGHFEADSSLAPVAVWLGQALHAAVRLQRDYLHGVEVAAGEVVLLENCRMNVGEKADDPELSKQYAALCEVFVMDAFGTAHRAQASTHGVIRYAPLAVAGPLLVAELDALGKALWQPERPMLAIVAGSKVSTKLGLLETLIDKVDQLIVGGGIANTFIAAAGYRVGNSLLEQDLLGAASKIMAAADARGAQVPIPLDVVVAQEFSASAHAVIKRIDEIATQDMILDIGPETSALYAEQISKAGTVVWNGPPGVFEFDAFGKGTEVLAHAIAGSAAFSIAGGGDTLAAIDKYGVASGIDCISTGGGAFLQFLEGKTLPAVAALETRAG